MTLNPDQLNATILAAERAIAHATPRSPAKEALSEALDCLFRARAHLDGTIPMERFNAADRARVLAEQADMHVQWARSNG
jgi:hypothetical protein